MPTTTPTHVRLAGYAPVGSTHSDALDRLAQELTARIDGLEVEIEHNVLDAGRTTGSLIEAVESGATTVCYLSTSYLVDRVPALGVLDLPYVFADLEEAHRALDGALGAALEEATRRATGLEPLGHWDNGFRHLSTRDRAVRVPADCAGLRVGLQPSPVHAALFRALGAEPVMVDLRERMVMLADGTLDAQENPLANTISYGVDRLHRHLTMTGHVYGARGVYASQRVIADWTPEARQALAVAARIAIAQQRADAEATERALRTRMEEDGVEIVDLDPAALAAFRAATAGVRDAELARLPEGIAALLPTSGTSNLGD